MQLDLRVVKPVVYGLLIFVTVGVTLANEMLSRFGLEDHYVWIFFAAFLIVVMLIKKNAWMVALVLFGVATVNLPDETLAMYSLDRDVLLAVVCSIILVPSVYSLFFR